MRAFGHMKSSAILLSYGNGVGRVFINNWHLLAWSRDLISHVTFFDLKNYVTRKLMVWRVFVKTTHHMHKQYETLDHAVCFRRYQTITAKDCCKLI